MNLKFTRKMKVAIGTTFVVALCGVTASCTDDYDLDDKGVTPGYISIYDLLKNPSKVGDQKNQLTGTFNYYLKLADDLGYAETLKRTGSKTVFPANDEAFERFFNDPSNRYGVSSYEELTETQKKQLLNGSMIDNAILTEMLSNVQQGGSVARGQALKHYTALNVTDTITHFTTAAQMPQNNPYWAKFAKEDRGIHVVMDATRPMMVHFTREQMLQNNITTSGANSDFEVITGKPYDAELNSTYIFRNPIIAPDIRALNGYVHQVRDVLLPESNIAEVIRTSGESDYFSRMLDRFSVPLYNANVTGNYNDYAQTYGLPTIDSIYAKRYFYSRSAADQIIIDDATNTNTRSTERLDFDPGNNNYHPNNRNELADMCAIFVPTDEAMEAYFLPGGGGAFLLEQYGKLPNTKENLFQNIDSIPLNLVANLVKNLMKPSFIESVPSKFNTVLNDATEPMGLSLKTLDVNADGTYNVKIANNGVAYMLNEVIAPAAYNCVYAPATIMDDMLIMRKAIEDGNTHNDLGLDLNFYAYLKAMRANYALFIPKDAAFASGQFYVDPTHIMSLRPRVLKFFIDENEDVQCSSWEYNRLTGEIGDSIELLNVLEFKTQLTDILNYNTIVLPPDVTLESTGNRYFKTKHGGAIEFYKENDSLKVVSGAQISNDNLISSTFDKSDVIATYDNENGTAYIINRLIQAPLNSVYSVLTDSINYPQFSEFKMLCTDARMDRLMIWASPETFEGVNPITKKDNTESYHPFIDKNGLTPNVNYFSSYNYTFYIPNNRAMAAAKRLGLPTWDNVYEIYAKWAFMTDEELEVEDPATIQKDKDMALAMIDQINGFIRYHIQNNSIYADNTVMADNLTPLSTTNGDDFATAYANALGVRMKLNLKGGTNSFTITDAANRTVTVDAASTTQLTNKMTRDYVFNAPAATTASSISTSSFAVIHEIASPLIHDPSGRLDGAWSGENAAAKLAKARSLFIENFYKRQ